MVAITRKGGHEVFDCPHCGVNRCQHRLVGEPVVYNVKRTVPGVKGGEVPTLAEATHLIFACSGCGRQTYFLVHAWGTVYEGQGDVSLLPTLAKAGLETVLQFPVGSPSGHPAVPTDIQRAADEAERCLAVRAPNASGVMTRRAVDALCQDKAAEGKDLYARLKHLRETHQITPDLWEWAEELRIVGRSGAHPEWEEVTFEEAEYGVRFLREILRYVYINPSDRQARKLKETKKRT